MPETSQTKLETYLGNNRGKLLGYIASRIDDPGVAEDILQGSLLKALEGAGELRDEEKLVSWFYQIIRNAIYDVYRKQGKQSRFLEQYVQEMEHEPNDEEEAAVCKCFIGLIPTLKPDYAEIIRLLELGKEDPATLAEKMGITQNNLKVKRLRARQQLRQRLKETCRTCSKHGCLDCTCQSQNT
ncbi:MAG: sigma-70 family RNA polymerase sigma factor [Balneolales bacterium]